MTMSASYFDLLKYAATGQASPSMSYYDRMRASTLMGGVVQTLTGIPPLTFKADGTPLISWSMKGNGSQQGTPTPDAPIMPTFCGVRTGNLFDESTIEVGGISQSTGEEVADSSRRRSGFIPCTPSTTYTISRPRNTTTSYLWVLKYRSDKTYIGVATSVGDSATFATGTGTAYLRWYTTQAIDYKNIMLNEGSTALPYEPYGYKTPLTCAGQTVPVYLGQVSTVRKIRKFVITGNENISSVTSQGVLVFLIMLPRNSMYHSSANGVICDRYISKYANQNGAIYQTNNQNGQIAITDNRFADRDEFKTYLQQQYAAGTPVTVWYILATPETATVNEPLAKIGTYADELSSTDAGVTIPTVKGQNTLTVDTPIQPSEMSITYKG